MTENPPDHLPVELLRGLTSRRVSRRGLLKVGGASALAMALAACGIPGAKNTTSGGTSQRQAIEDFWAKQKKNGKFVFANWPLYIDVGANGSDHPSLDLFTKQTGIKVTYKEVIQDVDSFFGKIQPVLSAGQSTGYDIMVLTNGRYLDKMIDLGYLIGLDPNRRPNFDVYAGGVFKSPSYDQGNVYTMPWQSGMTGIAYDPSKTGRDLTSWQDLQDPKFKGRVGMFADTEDLPNSALLAVGVKPETSTEADWHKAADWLMKQRSAGLVRKYYEQGYIDALSKGDIWASLAWSGDVFQANASGAHLKFVVPKEGAVLWTDNMCIPAHAANPLDAMTYMDFVYNPEVAAMLAEYINYITPVPSSQDVVKKHAAAATGDDKTTLLGVATSPLVYPTADDIAKLHRYRVLTTAEEPVWDSIFTPVFQS